MVYHDFFSFEGYKLVLLDFKRSLWKMWRGHSVTPILIISFHMPRNATKIKLIHLVCHVGVSNRPKKYVWWTPNQPSLSSSFFCLSPPHHLFYNHSSVKSLKWILVMVVYMKINLYFAGIFTRYPAIMYSDGTEQRFEDIDFFGMENNDGVRLKIRK